MSPADDLPVPPAGAAPVPLRSLLRAETAEAHRVLDEGLGRYDLADEADYRRFLRIHAHALLPLEAALADRAPWPAWQPRGGALRADLAALGIAVPPPLAVAPPATAAEAWGMLYVVEGSRLGGTLLARRVGAGLPAAYLGARHGPGEWRQFLDAMETDATSERYRELAVAGAQRTFAIFAEAAALECPIA